MRLALELVSHQALLPSFLEHTGFFKTLDTDLDGVVTFDLFKVGLSSGWVGEGTQGQWVFLTRPPRPGMGLEPAASESALRLATCVLHGHSKDLWFLRVGAGRPRPLEACTGASSLGSRGRGGKSGPLPRRVPLPPALDRGRRRQLLSHGAGRWDLGLLPWLTALYALSARQWLQLTMFA